MLFSRCLAFSAFACALAQDSAVRDAIEALQRGDPASAERMLRRQTAARPSDADALTVLGVVLDQEKKLSEADVVYRRALALAPHSPPLLNNYGNHLLAEGKLDEARTAYSEALNLNPGDVNACKQVARLALRQNPPAASACLDHLPPGAESDTDISILKMQADYVSGRKTQGDVILERLNGPAERDAKVSFQIGVALSTVRQYDGAEKFFDRALQLAPDNFEALYDLGLAASHAGHTERAADVLKQALDRQPENVDVLYDLAAVDAEVGQKETALELLARAARLAPDRAEVQRLIAFTSADLGDFADSVAAWDKYLKLVPGDPLAHRERAFAAAAFGQEANAGIADLRAYVRAHPNDAVGHYELGTAETTADGNAALQELSRALNLKPDLTAAHIARGLILYRQGNASAALPHFEAAAQQDPKNARVLDRLGETYTALNRQADALHEFQKAAELAPRDSSILLHLGRALANAGQKQQADAVFERFRELGPNKSALPHPTGLVDFLSLSPEEQYARYRAGVERTIEHSPDNAEAQVRYLGILLDDRKDDEARTTAEKILSLKPSSGLLVQAADELLSAEQYALAANFLRRATGMAQTCQPLKLDLTIAAFHLGNAQTALAQLEAMPDAARNGDYYLTLMQVFLALQKPVEANRAFEQALAAKPMHPEIYRQVALILIKQQRYPDAERLLQVAARVLPNDPDIPLLRAATAEPAANTSGSRTLVADFAARWPESARLWSQTER